MAKRHLKAPFIKVEDVSRKFKPDILEMQRRPTFNFGVGADEALFCNNITETNNRITQKKFCERCNRRFSSLSEHLRSNEHKLCASTKDSSYESLDAVIARGVSFEDYVKKLNCYKENT